MYQGVFYYKQQISLSPTKQSLGKERQDETAAYQNEVAFPTLNHYLNVPL